jgi:hypothetical protein
MSDALLIALLTQAGVHRGKAAELRSFKRRERICYYPSFDYLWERDAVEQDALAAVYENFADRLWRQQCA